MIVFLSSDLMFASRVLGAAKAVDVPVTLVADPARLAGSIAPDCRLVLIDLALDRLELPAAVQAIRQSAPRARIVGYGAHVDEAALANAATAGCDLVLTRGQFHQQYADLLRSVAAAGRGAGQPSGEN